MNPGLAPEAQAVLDFWFLPSGMPGHAQPRGEWFRKDPVFDESIRHRFGTLVESALSGGLDDWCSTPRGRLALIIVLDQFPRNLFRNQGRAFAGDVRARQLAEDMVAPGDDGTLSPVERWFAYLPFEHAESLVDQERSVALFTALAAAVPGHAEFLSALDYAKRHREIVHRFGRFPHRNSALRRATTAEEAAFLQEPGSSF